ncbi:Major allergen Alt a 1 [Fulvia fulva]|uniref:Major allergen Alt a 1 n=1 Tax=Passalora fulva TaxID=5499 RepID=A0A9Q8PMX1_PASFU|nr:Major allergen Alt a 1 [Fulvia fulva]KAK4609339.1 Major allergen Alt a 1 [Fulvia fulva]KAK4609768.1 Major allergen Alt a 1 [Fulvia fulva]UJO25400.1 Major allergen Alt a 1 [Fulvia fulva]WPV22937.1 Major allergen Alt a 1 [Fulvia fulva]WPV37575.1 Major allergen Alt a 1 [Fulvia fulva]
MKFTLAAAAALFTTALAGPVARTDDTIYQIKDFTLRKLDGKNISTMFFRILATNGGTLDFECSPYDPVTDAATERFEPDHVYFCGKNSVFSFNYIPAHDTQTNELFLWQHISETETLGGNAFLNDPICHAGGSNVNDFVCVVPPQEYFAITMKKLGA